jgi:MoxR-like ATPase
MTRQSQPRVLKFEGKELLGQPAGAHRLAPTTPEPYIASPRLVTAVNLAITLRRPLLLEGDPGCGKTCLARAVAFELGLPFFRWNIQSTTKALDGQYIYDALGRLHDVQIQKSSKAKMTRDPSSATDYCKMGELGKAFEIQDCTSVVLIDEVDKAEMDFPNDLLTVLDEPWEFVVKETDRTIAAHREYRPIVIITSNKEKGNLPDAFLRRCLYHYVEFPSREEDLKKIIKRHYTIQEQTMPQVKLQKAAIDRFLSLRNEGGLKKKPGTSEFLDWLKALQTFGEKPYDAGKLSRQTDQIPYGEMLLKIREDWQKFKPAT